MSDDALRSKIIARLSNPKEPWVHANFMVFDGVDEQDAEDCINDLIDEGVISYSGEYVGLEESLRASWINGGFTPGEVDGSIKQ